MKTKPTPFFDEISLSLLEISNHPRGSEAQHICFKEKSAILLDLWKKDRITWEQLYELYQLAQEEMDYYWQNVEIEEILT
jgi:hypothetical protein